MQIKSQTGAASSGVLARIERISKVLSTWCNRIAGAGLIAMLGLIIGDILGIKVFKNPIPGGIEVVGFLGVMVIGFALGNTQVIKGHTLVDFFTSKMTKRYQAVCESIVTFFSLVTIILLVWRSADYANILQKSGEVSMTQKIPFYPFVYLLAFCFLVFSLAILVDLIKAIQKVAKR